MPHTSIISFWKEQWKPVEDFVDFRGKPDRRGKTGKILVHRAGWFPVLVLLLDQLLPLNWTLLTLADHQVLGSSVITALGQVYARPQDLVVRFSLSLNHINSQYNVMVHFLHWPHLWNYPSHKTGIFWNQNITDCSVDLLITALVWIYIGPVYIILC